MLIGYARVSTGEQNLDLQVLALKKSGCRKIFQEKVSGKAKRRPVLDTVLDSLKEGDTLVVWHLDRLGRRTRELINLEYEFKCHGIELKSLTQNIDTSTPIGEYLFHVTCANAQLESARISERTKAGLLAARARGKYPGRPRCLSRKQMRRAKRLRDEKHRSFAEIAATLRCGQATVWRALRESGCRRA